MSLVGHSSDALEWALHVRSHSSHKGGVVEEYLFGQEINYCG
jgi:hypothetical protein